MTVVTSGRIKPKYLRWTHELCARLGPSVTDERGRIFSLRNQISTIVLADAEEYLGWNPFAVIGLPKLSLRLG